MCFCDGNLLFLCPPELKVYIFFCITPNQQNTFKNTFLQKDFLIHWKKKYLTWLAVLQDEYWLARAEYQRNILELQGILPVIEIEIRG